MGEAPYFLFFNAGLIGDPAFGFEHIQGIANVC
jgi:hypothetical protein